MNCSKYGTEEERNELIVLCADRYIRAYTSTLRDMEQRYGIPKSTLHTWFHKILMNMDDMTIRKNIVKLMSEGKITPATARMNGSELKLAVYAQISNNLSMRATRGGKATRERYLRMNGQSS